MGEQVDGQDVIGQFPLLKTYNHGIFCFPINDETSHASVTKSLEAAVDRVVSRIPWLGDQVINEGKASGDSGLFKNIPWPSDALPNSRIRVKDCSDSFPTYAKIIEAQGPISMLDGNMLCPFPGFPLSYEEAEIGPAPVVAIQANFIKGGLLLNFSNQHNMMDATGLFTFIMLLAAAMRGEELPDQTVEQANRDRKTVVPLLGAHEPIRSHEHLRRPPPSPSHQSLVLPPQPPVVYKWAYFRFLKKHIPRVKALASPSTSHSGTSEKETVAFISSNDALCAFYWQRLAIVRLLRNKSQGPMAVSKFSRAIDARSAMRIPMGYMGQMVYQAATHLSLQDLVDSPLSVIAAQMRKDLNEANTEHSVRSYATFLAGVKDKSTLAYGGVFNPALDIGSSSMATAAVGGLGFGVLGEPELMRRPRLAPVPGCLYFYPPERDGNLPVLVCLSERDLEAIKMDEEWSGCTDFIG
ncbi:MAG: hypothetical protein L6R40_006302 [Gallowayella cf. fulva]|nr:MAG: hypothetical protein L6R40_006302 [Xanthomendoza cf. fulva]